MAISSNIESFMGSVDSAMEEMMGQIVPYLIKVGEEAVQVALDTKTYQDKTGNLTASIGFGVYDKGKLVHVGGFGGGEGEQLGVDFLSKQTSLTPMLQIVAAMPYAQYVERAGFAVLDGMRIRAEGIVDTVLSQFIAQ